MRSGIACRRHLGRVQHRQPSQPPVRLTSYDTSKSACRDAAGLCHRRDRRQEDLGRFSRARAGGDLRWRLRPALSRGFAWDERVDGPRHSILSARRRGIDAHVPRRTAGALNADKNKNAAAARPVSRNHCRSVDGEECSQMHVDRERPTGKAVFRYLWASRERKSASATPTAEGRQRACGNDGTLQPFENSATVLQRPARAEIVEVDECRRRKAEARLR